jgi:hypothetical protein
MQQMKCERATDIEPSHFGLWHSIEQLVLRVRGIVGLVWGAFRGAHHNGHLLWRIRLERVFRLNATLARFWQYHL